MQACDVVRFTHHHTDHCAAGCVCRDGHTNLLHVYVWEEEWAIVYREVVDGKECKIECAIVLYSHPLEIEICERIVLSRSRVHSALKPPQIRGVSSDCSDVEKLVVEPPALSFYS